MLKRTVKTATRRLGLFPVARHLYRRFDPDVRRARASDRVFFARIIRPGDLVFDIGANLGQKSEVFLACGAKVVAVEPNPMCAPSLRFEFARARDFTLVEKAIGATIGRARLNVVGTDSTASVRDDWRWLTEDGALKASAVDVDMTTLDALIAEYGAPAYCKIDVEGFELDVLKGLSRPTPDLISFEYHASEKDRLIACIDILAALAPIEINLIAMNGGDFLQDWAPPAEALNRIGADLPEVGDVFVRMKPETGGRASPKN